MEFENVLDDFLGDRKLNIFLFKNVKVVAWWSPRMVAINVCNAQESGQFHGHLASSYKVGSGFLAGISKLGKHGFHSISSVSMVCCRRVRQLSYVPTT